MRAKILYGVVTFVTLFCVVRLVQIGPAEAANISDASFDCVCITESERLPAAADGAALVCASGAVPAEIQVNM